MQRIGGGGGLNVGYFGKHDPGTVFRKFTLLFLVLRRVNCMRPFPPKLLTRRRFFVESKTIFDILTRTKFELQLLLPPPPTHHFEREKTFSRL